MLTKPINVTTNDAQNRTPVLTCAVTVKVPYDMSPNMINFGTIERDSVSEKRSFKIKRGDGGPLKPQIQPIKDKNIKAELKEITPGEEYELEVEAVPPWPATAVQGYIDFKTGIADSPDDKIRYYARMAVRLRAAPNRISVPANLENDLSMRTRLLWSGNEPGKVLEVTATDPKIKAQFSEENGFQYIDVVIPKGYESSPRGNFIVVKTDDKEVPELRIQVSPIQARNVTTPVTRTSNPAAGVRPTLRPRPGITVAPKPPERTNPPAEDPEDHPEEEPVDPTGESTPAK